MISCMIFYCYSLTRYLIFSLEYSIMFNRSVKITNLTSKIKYEKKNHFTFLKYSRYSSPSPPFLVRIFVTNSMYRARNTIYTAWKRENSIYWLASSLPHTERPILHEESFEQQAGRKRTVRGIQRRLDLRDIEDPRLQLHVPAGAGRTLRILQQKDERVGRYDERTVGSEGGSSDRGSDHHVRSGTGGRLHHAVHESGWAAICFIYDSLFTAPS